MLKRTLSWLMLGLLFPSILILPLEVEPAGASGTVYIRADGSIDPSTAPISTVDNVTYTFTGNISDPIVVERDDIVVDGSSYTVQGTGVSGSRGIDLTGRSNVTIKNTNTRDCDYGIWLYSSSSNNVNGNNITANNFFGIYLDSSSSNNLSENNITANGENGIHLYSSSNNIVSGNTIANNGWGIILEFSSDNSMSGNNITKNSYSGIHLYSSSGNSICGNDITIHSYDGIDLYSSSVNSIRENNITANDDIGILLYSSSNYNSVSGNNIASNDDYGIRLGASSSNTISGNNITANSENGINFVSSSGNRVWGNNIVLNYVYGIRLDYSSNNDVYHNNFVNNAQQVYSISSTNTWDDGYPSAGNYWSDYAGVDLHSGPYQNETGSDGIGDTTYTIDGSNKDNYPLFGYWVPPDTAALNLTTQKGIVGFGFSLNLTLMVENQGDMTESLKATIYANDTAISYQTFLLKGGDSLRYDLVGDTNSLAHGNYTLVACVTPLQGETDTADNVFIGGTVYVGIPGDINADGIVEMMDFMVASSAFASWWSHLRWNSNADINNDAIVEMMDFFIMAQHYLEHI